VSSRTRQLVASVFLGVVVLATVGVCEAGAHAIDSRAAHARPIDRHAAFVAGDDAVAATSVAPSPPQALPPQFSTTTPATPTFLVSLLPLHGSAPCGKTPLYLRDRALLL
jgi:hypothetical protein